MKAAAMPNLFITNPKSFSQIPNDFETNLSPWGFAEITFLVISLFINFPKLQLPSDFFRILTSNGKTPNLCV